VLPLKIIDISGGICNKKNFELVLLVWQPFQELLGKDFSVACITGM
jgi:hypothetical protein